MAGDLISAWKDLRWLDRGRVAAYAKMLLAVEVVVVVYGQLRFWRQGSDFTAFWSGAQFVLSGRAAAAYDVAQVAAYERGLGFGVHPFINPPPYLAVVAPLGWLSYPAALTAWCLATCAAYALAVRWLPKSVRWPVLAFPVAAFSIMAGQNGLLTTALLVAAVGLLPRRAVLAGGLIGLMAIKPQLAVLVPVALIAGREWRAFAAAAVTAIAFAGLSVALFGLETLRAFMAASQYSAGLFAIPELLPKIKSVYAAVLLFGGPRALAVGAQAAAGVFGAWAVWRVWRRTDDRLSRAAVLLAATPLATPYLLLYDVVFLVVPMAWLGLEGVRRGFRPGERWLLAALYASPLLAFAVSAAPVVPLLGLGLSAMILQRLDREQKVK